MIDGFYSKYTGLASKRQSLRIGFVQILWILVGGCLLGGMPHNAFASYQIKHRQSSSNQIYSKTDIWQVLRKEMNLDHQADRPEVRAQVQWFLKHPKFMYQLAENAKPYMYYVLHQIRVRKLPIELILLPMIESGYNPFAYSKAGAAGLWQMMPGTASGFGLKQTWWYDGRRDVIASTNAALDYLAYLEDFFNGDWELAIAAYDSGEGSVLNAVRRNVAKGAKTDFWSLHLPQETLAYIPKVLALAEIFTHPNKYDVELPVIPNEPYMMVVDVGTQIDLKTAASLSNLSLADLLKLNPGYNRWATSPDGPFKLVLPIEKVDFFKHNLAELPETKRVTWKRYKVTRNDTLGGIAQTFHTSSSLLKEVNKLSSDTIHVGDTLFIPLSTARLPYQVIQSAQKYVDADQKQLPGPRKIVYTVQSNDSLWKVSNKFHVKEAAIQFWNGMKRGQVLQPGEQIIMWVKPSQSNKNPLKVQEVSYEVVAGDTLGKIARHFNTTIDTIKQLNHLTSNALHPGQALQVYQNLLVKYDDDQAVISYQILPGDSLNKIAYQFDTSPEVIKALNGLNTVSLKAGDSLMVIPHALPSLKNPHNHRHTPPQKKVYLVQPGDSLSQIARKLNVSVAELKHWNGGNGRSKALVLHPYTLLTVYL